MNIEELKKRVRGNGFQESHGSTTMVIDVETVIDLLDDLAAINFTGSSLELPTNEETNIEIKRLTDGYYNEGKHSKSAFGLGFSKGVGFCKTHIKQN